MKVFLLLIITTLSFLANAQQTPLPAFPGAEGFGAFTPGGRGGQVLIVTTLDDYLPGFEDPIPGSFRAAVDTRGPRIIVFRVGGTIELKAPIHIAHSFITIAGQTAPGDGIALKNHSLVINGKPGEPVTDVIIRYLRVRPGDLRRFIGDKAPHRDDGAFTGNDGIGLHNAENIIIDHCSASWGVDETLEASGNVKNVTIQWCIVSEGLHNSTNFKGGHSKGLMVGYNSTNFSLHHNLIMHSSDRNPYLPAEYDEPFLIDMVNNVVYNWWFNAGISYKKTNHNGMINFVGNYFIPGLNSWKRPGLALGVNTKVYAKDNICPFRTSSDQDEFDAIHWEVADDPTPFQMKEPFDVPPVTTTSYLQAYHDILALAGASLPIRDQVDLRLIEELKLRKGKIIDHPSQVGGWPFLRNGKAPLDSDGDGMPDEWEIRHGLDPIDPSDAIADRNDDGYTNIEEYINQITAAPAREPLPVLPGNGSARNPVKIPYQQRGFVVDGYADDWQGIARMPMPFMDNGVAEVRLAWREDGLYGLVEVKDTLLYIYEEEPYRGDCVELWVDKLNLKTPTREENRHAFQVIFSPTENLITHHAAINVPRDWPTENLNFIYSQWKKTRDGYNIEFVIPALTMRPAQLRAGTKIGLNVGVSDNGEATTQFYSDKSANAFLPVNWGTIELVKE
jgi:pectate lyase